MVFARRALITDRAVTKGVGSPHALRLIRRRPSGGSDTQRARDGGSRGSANAYMVAGVRPWLCCTCRPGVVVVVAIALRGGNSGCRGTNATDRVRLPLGLLGCSLRATAGFPRRHASCGAPYRPRVRVRAGRRGRLGPSTRRPLSSTAAPARGAGRMTLYEATFRGPRAAPSPRVCGNCAGSDGDAGERGHRQLRRRRTPSRTGLLAEPTDAFRAGAVGMRVVRPPLEAMLEFELGRESAGDGGALVSRIAAPRRMRVGVVGGSGGSSAVGGGGERAPAATSACAEWRFLSSSGGRGMRSHGGDGGRPWIDGRRRGCGSRVAAAAPWAWATGGGWARGRREPGAASYFVCGTGGVGKESMVALSTSGWARASSLRAAARRTVGRRACHRRGR